MERTSPGDTANKIPAQTPATLPPEVDSMGEELRLNTEEGQGKNLQSSETAQGIGEALGGSEGKSAAAATSQQQQRPEKSLGKSVQDQNHNESSTNKGEASSAVVDELPLEGGNEKAIKNNMAAGQEAQCNKGGFKGERGGPGSGHADRCQGESLKLEETCGRDLRSVRGAGGRTSYFRAHSGDQEVPTIRLW